MLEWSIAILYHFFKDFAGPIATVVAASVAASFAWQQIRTAKLLADVAKQQADTALDQLRHNLFERRYSIYKDIQNLIGELVNWRGIDEKDLNRHYVVMLEARFFFPPDICSWMDDVKRDCQRLMELRNSRADQKEEDAAIQRLVAHYEGMPARFEKELGFRQLTRRV